MLQKIKEYYPRYLSLHSHPMCRALHLLGQVATYSYIVYCIVNNHYLALFAAPFIVYPFAWTGHVLFEKNKPAAWSDPVLAKICDHIMCFNILRGRISLWKK